MNVCETFQTLRGNQPNQDENLTVLYSALNPYKTK